MSDADAATRLQGSAYPDDDGRADPALAAALTSYDAARDDPARLVEVLGRLAAGRLVVPVVAVLGESEVDERGLVTDKSSDMAVVLLQSATGRPGLLAFTGTEALAAWDATARPVPVPARLAAQAALQEGAAALVVDVAGPVLLVLQGADLDALAAGWTPALLEGEQVWIGRASE